MTDGVKITIKKNEGITQALLRHVREQNMEMSDGSISSDEWSAAIDKIDEINDARIKSGESIFSGGQDRKDWHKNYVVHTGDEITFTADEMTEIYKALGVSFTIQQNDVKKTDDLLDNNAQLDSLALQNKEQITNLNDTLNTEQEQEADVSTASKKKSNGNGKGGLIAFGVLTAAVLLFATRGKIKKAFKSIANLFKKSPTVEVKPQEVNEIVLTGKPVVEPAGQGILASNPVINPESGPKSRTLNNGAIKFGFTNFNKKGNRINHVVVRNNNSHA